MKKEPKKNPVNKTKVKKTRLMDLKVNVSKVKGGQKAGSPPPGDNTHFMFTRG
jgi:hypothetical protein